MECWTPICMAMFVTTAMALKTQPRLSMSWQNHSFKMLKFLNQPFTASPWAHAHDVAMNWISKTPGSL